MHSRYHEIHITPTKYFSLFADFILDLGIEAVEYKNDTIIVRDENDPKDLIWGIKRFADSLSKAKGDNISVKIEEFEKKNEDWIRKFKESISSVEIGKFYIHPTWENEKDGYVNIAIDPSLSFGTGHHESTSSCLEFIGRVITKDNTFLDVGCGSGILSIAACKLGAKVDICDTDPLSIESAKKNFELNGCNYGDIWVGSADKSDKLYDVVVANIVADILVMIKDDLINRVKKGGKIVLSGILQKYNQKVLSEFSDMRLLDTINKGEWTTLLMERDR